VYGRRSRHAGCRTATQKIAPAARPACRAIIRALIANDPNLDRRKLADRPETRVRKGDVRVFYTVEADGTLLVTRIADRKDAYRS
jgi:mRNA-degrading endonuclease RelE of RelBE toxin-antitoxin system